MIDEVAGSRYAASESGWIDQELFHYWLVEHFIDTAISARPLLLLLDGHSSHFMPQTIKYVKEHGIVMFCLPPHTTHECQPLDCSLDLLSHTGVKHVIHSTKKIQASQFQS